jgi:L-ascorbate metabolism protein UlaG (beta-lactamase superfamily)
MATTILHPLSITWFGHSAFLLLGSGGTSVLIDPWLDNPKSPVRPGGIDRPDLVLITHGHGDHIGNVVEIAGRFDVPVVAIHEVSLYLASQGVRSAMGMNKGGTLEAAGVRVTMTHAVHSSDIDVGGAGKLLPGGEPAGFVIEIPGHPKVYHAGDTDVFGDMRIIRDLHRPEIAILPIGGLYTMGPREAAMAVGFLEPRHAIGMHYGTFPPLKGTPAELRSYLPSPQKGIVAELIPGTPASFA